MRTRSHRTGTVLLPIVDGTSGPRSGGSRPGCCGHAHPPRDPPGRCSPSRSSSTSSRPVAPAAARAMHRTSPAMGSAPSASPPSRERRGPADRRRLDRGRPALERVTGRPVAVPPPAVRSRRRERPWISRPTPTCPSRRPRPSEASSRRRRRRLVHGPQPRLDPGARDRPLGRRATPARRRPTRATGCTAGAAPDEQRLPLRPRPQRVQGAPRRVCPRTPRRRA